MPRKSRKDADRRQPHETFKRWFYTKYLKWGLDQYGATGETGRGLPSFADYLGVSRYDVYRYARGATVPKGVNLDAIARKLGDDVYALLEIKPTDRNQKTRLILSELDNLNDDEVEKVIEIVQASRQRRLVTG
jgi:hypothetical protein